MAVRVDGAFVRVVTRGGGVASMRMIPCGVGRAVTVARYDTAVRATGTGVVVIEGLIGIGVAASAGAAGVVAAVGARDATAVAVPAPSTPPLPVATDVATAGAVMAPSLIVVTVGVAVGTPARRAADVTVPVAPPLEVTVAEAGASFAGAVTLPVTPDRVPDTEMAVEVAFAAPAVPMAPGPLPPRLPRATRPVAGVVVGWDDAAAARAVTAAAAARTVTAAAAARTVTAARVGVV